LDYLDSADNLAELSGHGLHPLSGDRKGTWAMSVNGPWRITFQEGLDGWIDVDLEQYH